MRLALVFNTKRARSRELVLHIGQPIRAKKLVRPHRLSFGDGVEVISGLNSVRGTSATSRCRSWPISCQISVSKHRAVPATYVLINSEVATVTEYPVAWQDSVTDEKCALSDSSPANGELTWRWTILSMHSSQSDSGPPVSQKYALHSWPSLDNVKIYLSSVVEVHGDLPAGHTCDIVRIDHVVIWIPRLPEGLFEFIIVLCACTGRADVLAVFL